MTNSRIKVLGLLGIPLFAVAMLAVFLSWSLSSNEASADVAAHGGLDFHVGANVNGVAGDECSSEGVVKCFAPIGGAVAFNIYLDDLGDIPSYEGFDVIINFAGVTTKKIWTPRDDETNTTAFSCDFPAEDFSGQASGEAAVGCASDNAAPSTFEGALGTVSFNCTASGSITIVYGNGNTGVTGGGAAHSPLGAGEGVTINCVAATVTPTSPPTATPAANPAMRKLDNDVKVPDEDPNGDNLSSIFMTRQGTKIPPQGCTSTNTTVFEETLNIPIPVEPDPKDPTIDQELGAFEFEIRYDDKYICLELLPGPAADDMICFVEDDITAPTLENLVRIGCVTQGKEAFPDTTTPEGRRLATIVVRPMEEVYSLVRPNQENGMAMQLLNQDCELADLQGHPIKTFSCEDADVTLRFLEGDVAGPDCAVDTLDTQALAFRWGVSEGKLLYQRWFDLEPSGGVSGDGDVDIKDLQFAFGRFGSTCKDQWPPQPPVNPKA